jgi:hypothetical protein
LASQLIQVIDRLDAQEAERVGCRHGFAKESLPSYSHVAQFPAAAGLMPATT